MIHKRISRYMSFVISALLLLWAYSPAEASDSPNLLRLHVDGRNLVDENGKKVLLHGFAQNYSPYFNEGGTYWTNYDVEGCLSYNKTKIDQVLEAGWKVNWLRLQMEPYWSNTPDKPNDGDRDISAFSMYRFKIYFDAVYVPIMKYAVAKGIYVVMRPPGSAPKKIAVGDDYQQYLLDIWTYVASHPAIKDNPAVMFELTNEPVEILGTDGKYEGKGDPQFEALQQYYQPIVDVIREQGFNNVIWIPGLGYQSRFEGLAKYKIQDDNIGFAVHCYPGWYDSDAEKPSAEFGEVEGKGYEGFSKRWNAQIGPVAAIAPILVTEVDWAPEKYNSSWGKSITGTPGGRGFGANFKKIADDMGNVSWLIFTRDWRMALYDDGAPDGETFLTDPEACVRPVYRWFKEYAQKYDFVEAEKENPLLWADFPDPDIIRVGDYFYMVTTTMHMMPGCPVMRSRDLVNWETISYVFDEINDTQRYQMIDGTVYGRGQWATSIRYHDGKFYVLFCPNDDPWQALLYTAGNPSGPWTLHARLPHYHDASMLFDDDGKVYVVHGSNGITLTELNNDLTAPSTNGTNIKIITLDNETNGLHEGSRIIKHGGKYYILAVNHPNGGSRRQLCYRSDNIKGPYERAVILEYNLQGFGYAAQGCIVDDADGIWWGVFLQNRGAVGRVLTVGPVKWTDGWPIIGSQSDKTLPETITYNRHTMSHSTIITSSDYFENDTLHYGWQWNHVPDNDCWSLSERPGFLRLYTHSKPVGNIFEARNTLTQRMCGPKCCGIIRMDLSGMVDGDVAGFSSFNGHALLMSISKVGSKYVLKSHAQRVNFDDKKRVLKVDDVPYTSVEFTNDVIYLRYDCNFKKGADLCNAFYSIDGTTWNKVANNFKMSYDHTRLFMGQRFAIFNYATKSPGIGCVDIDEFIYEPNEYSGSSDIESVIPDAMPSQIDVFNMQGIRIRHNVCRENALDGLAPGIYIIGNKKVLKQN